jgi:6-phospho-beta-glucosidase
MLFDSVGCEVQLKKTSNRIEALDNADIILTTFRPGGFEARHQDESIPLLYGLIGNETVGPGGLMMACRAIPIMLEIAQEVERVSPQAIILNYTNPSHIVTYAVSTYSNARIIGLCDQHIAESHAIANLLNVEPSRVKCVSHGINHATWITEIQLDGENIIEEFLKRDFEPEDERVSLSLELGRHYHMIPTYYLHYYYFRGRMLEKARNSPQTRSEEIMQALPEIWQSYRDAIETKNIYPHKQRGGSDHGEFALDVIKALQSDEEHCLNLNLVNGDAFQHFSTKSVVEGPAIVSKAKVNLIPQPSLPKEILGLLQAIDYSGQLAAEAAVEGDQQKLIQAISANPLVLDFDISCRLVHSLIHNRLIPSVTS